MSSTDVGLPNTPMGRRLQRLRADVVRAAQRRGASNLRVFGSVARGDDTDTSDIDLLVDLEDNVSLVTLIGLERELAALLERPVDVVPARNLKPAIAERIANEVIQL